MNQVQQHRHHRAPPCATNLLPESCPLKAAARDASIKALTSLLRSCKVAFVFQFSFQWPLPARPTHTRRCVLALQEGRHERLPRQTDGQVPE